MTYSTVVIIYNPNSTGSSEANAKTFADSLKQRLPKQKIELIGTERQGHADELAYLHAKATKNPLIISSSGDGGYNEVINGAMRAKQEGATPTVGLLPSGNANDHYHSLHDGDTIEAVVQNKTKNIDMLKLTSISDGKQVVRYAHSYIGFGLTPHVSEELNKTKLNLVKETILVIRVLFTLKAVWLKLKKKAHPYDSVIISNVTKMSKYFIVSQPSRMTDGKFEVTIFRRRNKLALSMLLLRSSIGRIKEDLQTDHYTLETVNKTLVQLDGEVLTLDPKVRVTIDIEKQVISSIV